MIIKKISQNSGNVQTTVQIPPLNLSLTTTFPVLEKHLDSIQAIAKKAIECIKPKA